MLNGEGKVFKLANKKSWLSRIKFKFSELDFKQKLAVLIGFGAAIIGLLIISYSIANPSPKNTKMPVDNQEVDQEALDRAIDQFQRDPSSIPSGKFNSGQVDNFVEQKDNTLGSGATQ